MVTGPCSTSREVIRCQETNVPPTVMACMSIFMAVPLGAEPTPAIKYLMQEPVSMLDWGLQRLENNLYRNSGILTKHDGNLFEPEPVIRADYDWDKNRIQIFVKLTLDAKVKKTPPRMSAVRSHIEFLVAYLRGTLTMMPYDAFFRHKGFRSKESPENLAGELVETTDILVSVRDNRQNILSSCKAPLSGQEIFWSKIGGQ